MKASQRIRVTEFNEVIQQIAFKTRFHVMLATKIKIVREKRKQHREL